jgi:hypothetical protein
VHVFHRPRPAWLLCPCAVLLSISLAACGGSSPQPAAAKNDEQQFVKFAKCLREHGINVSTPTGAHALRFTGTDPHAMDAAQNACRRFRPRAATEKLSPAERAARQDAALKFARCMRSHGVNIPDPQVDNGGIGIHLAGKAGKGASGGPNPSSPTFQAAQNACQGLLGKNAPKLSTQSAGPAGGPAGGGPGGSLSYGTGG